MGTICQNSEIKIQEPIKLTEKRDKNVFAEDEKDWIWLGKKKNTSQGQVENK